MELGNVKDGLARAYFEKFSVRVEVLPEYHRRLAYSDVICEAQEALELFIQGLLRHLGHEPSQLHDPGRELLGVADKVPKPFAELVPKLAQWSKKLRKERELAYYGAADYLPTENYSIEESQETIEFLEMVRQKLESWSQK